MENRTLLLPTLARTSPVTFAIMLLMNCIFCPSYNSFYLLVMYCIINMSNFVAKNLIFKPLYKIIGKDNIYLLGSGYRPKGATGCNFTIDGKASTTFGMPSGHSQIAWFLATYIIYNNIENINTLINNNNQNVNNTIIMEYIWNILSSIIILVIATYISYSRVYIDGCHTIQQAIVGSILGIVCGIIVYYFRNNVKTLLQF